MMCPLLLGLQKLYIPVRFLPTLLPTLNLGETLRTRESLGLVTVTTCVIAIEAADLMDFQLLIACPKGFEQWYQRKNNCELVANLCLAADGVDLVVTDVWASMGDESEKKDRERAFTKFEVNQEVMDKANSDALFMHVFQLIEV